MKHYYKTHVFHIHRIKILNTHANKRLEIHAWKNVESKKRFTRCFSYYLFFLYNENIHINECINH